MSSSSAAACWATESVRPKSEMVPMNFLFIRNEPRNGTERCCNIAAEITGKGAPHAFGNIGPSGWL